MQRHCQEDDSLKNLIHTFYIRLSWQVPFLHRRIVAFVCLVISVTAQHFQTLTRNTLTWLRHWRRRRNCYFHLSYLKWRNKGWKGSKQEVRKEVPNIKPIFFHENNKQKTNNALTIYFDVPSGSKSEKQLNKRLWEPNRAIHFLTINNQINR